MVKIRAAAPDDLDVLYRICLQTGDAGQDANALYEEPRLLGDIFVAPYMAFEPSLAFAAEDAEGVAGFVLGALDTRAFENRLEREWWPDLRARYPDPGTQPSTVEQFWMAHIHRPSLAPDDLAGSYPSHLHINLLPRLQGKGIGKQLMNTLTDALREQGSRGVHLDVWAKNTRAIGFYRHLGMAEVGRNADGSAFALSFR